jgi:hypothetical protein
MESKVSHSPIYFPTMLEGIRFQLNMQGFFTQTTIHQVAWHETMHWYCVLKTHFTHGFIGICEISVTFVHSYDHVSFVDTFIYVSNLFQCMIFVCKCTNLWVHKFCTIFIINLSHITFVRCNYFHNTTKYCSKF